MIFYVYMDPNVLSTENLQHKYAMQTFIGTVRGFLQNCFIAEFEDYRIQESIKIQVNRLPDSFDRKIIKALLKTLMKRNHFIYCLIPDHSGIKNDFTCALEQAAGTFLDLLLVEEIDDELEIPAGVEIASLATYQNTDFEIRRSKLASDGLIIKNGNLEEEDFWDQCLKKALRFSTRIEICDRLFGKMFADNYKYNVKIMLRWLERILIDPDNCSLLFHCEKPDGFTDQYMAAELTALKKGRISNMPIAVQFYQHPGLANCLPHARFILTDQIVLKIDPGMDFLDPKTGKNRDACIECKSSKEVNTLLKSYSHAMLPLVSI
ncbi:MAG: hypothetical protein U9N86_14310 [Bacteroidota bacterium]|nr:hypothetical protein [Bacteroidota bacterium]